METRTLDQKIFKKVLDSSVQAVKSAAQVSIKNKLRFCCKILDVAEKDPDDPECSVFAETSQLVNWLNNLFTEELKYKVLNLAALENLKKKGLMPSLQPIEIILVIIIASNDSVVVGVSFPDGTGTNITDFANNAMKRCPKNDTECNVNGNCAYITYKCEFPFKDRDTVSRAFFEQLQKDGIYVKDDDDDEETPNYLNDNFVA